MRARNSAFTLIELLVVVTIIVTLMALLTPALDGAIYQAQLATCASNQKTIATGMTLYASGNRRSYPDRRALYADLNAGTHDGQPTQLNDPWTGGGTPEATDDRPIVKQFVSLPVFLDPLCEKIDIDPADTATHKTSNGQTDSPNPFVSSGFQLFYGWRYADSPGQRGMYKLGDRFTWAGASDLLHNSPPTGGGSWGGSFDVLVTDQNSMTLTNGGFICSHPDERGLLSLDTKRNEAYPSNTAIAGVNEGFYFVLSRWGISNTSERRGAVDVNTAHTDASVTRMNSVAWDEEERVTSAPIDITGPGSYTYWLVLPR